MSDPGPAGYPASAEGFPPGPRNWVDLNFHQRLVTVLSVVSLASSPPYRLVLSSAALALAIGCWGSRASRVPHVVLLSAWATDGFLRLPYANWLALNLVAGLEAALGVSAKIGLTILSSCGSLALIVALFLLPPKRPALLLMIHLLLTVGLLIFSQLVLVPIRANEATFLLTASVYVALTSVVSSGGLLWCETPTNESSVAGRVGVGVALGLGLVCLSFRLSASSAAHADLNSTVTFLWPDGTSDRTHDYDTASAGYGYHAIGLFGEWPRVLERSGYRVLRATQLDDPVLRETRVLVVASAIREWLPGELDRIIRWVEAGGSLLVVGEHSDLEGCQRLLNPLLRPFGLGLNFDTTNGLLGDGLHSVVLTFHPIGQALEAAPYLPYNRGASISIHGRARPVLVGRLWHADEGDRLAPFRANLSDYLLSEGDRMGDVVMMAATEKGSGRIVVVGDSTPFLNQNTLYASGFLLDLMAIITTPVSSGMVIRAIGWLAGLAAGLLTYYFARGRVTWILLGVLLLAQAVLNGAWPASQAALRWSSTQRLGVVSIAENNLIEKDPFSSTAPTALGLALARAEMTPWLGDWSKLQRRPQVVAIINPTRTPQAGHWKRLMRWLHEGTLVIVAGDGDNPAFREIASRAGVLVTETPVGSIGGEDLTTYSAWRVTSCPEQSSRLQAKSFLIGCLTPMEKGLLVVVADGGFFLSRNLETEDGYDEKNLRFLGSVLQRQKALDGNRPGTTPGGNQTRGPAR